MKDEARNVELGDLLNCCLEATVALKYRFGEETLKSRLLFDWFLSFWTSLNQVDSMTNRLILRDELSWRLLPVETSLGFQCLSRWTQVFQLDALPASLRRQVAFRQLRTNLRIVLVAVQTPLSKDSDRFRLRLEAQASR